ncbi:hypothetical protein [Enterovirga rhinocerotis]|uniref:Uncharacterized protein n=1 Tax=Enterovirga rhinocerotis TaxID=1339210 RepID=A0A4R7C8U0_9HYPH|nr:hypothetical protein [Enterovirga rhinocerotis]TDR93735.1 hypothetical protein EV668_1000 [Enterovirga rhinocerotis]
MTRLRPATGLCVALVALVPAVAQAQPLPPPAIRDGLATPSLPPVASPTIPPPDAPSGPQQVTLSAFLSGDSKPIRSGIVWRIFLDRGSEAAPEFKEKLTTPTPTTTLPPGSYIVHAAYGLAATTRRITVASSPIDERLAIEAGALQLSGAIGDIPIPPERVMFSIYQPLPNDSEGRLVAANVKAGELVRLPEGTYHVVSTYGESNAIMRTDLRVDRGKITDATLNHRAATVTLKLVAAAGGEAFAGTAFSVLTPGGDVIREAIGAFPTVVLAEGEYTVIARHNGKVYTREFRVESGLNSDIEVLVDSG